MTSKRKPVRLETERLVIRMCGPEEADRVVDYFAANREHLIDHYPTWGEDFLTSSFWRQQLLSSQSEYEQDQSLRLFMFLKQDGPDMKVADQVVGTINFSGFVRRAAQYCVLGYGLDARLTGKGYMTEALEISIAFVFDELNLHRVMANYVPTNDRSGKLLKRLGFVVEGYARDYLYLNGQWRDHILTSLTNHNWKDRSDNTRTARRP